MIKARAVLKAGEEFINAAEDNSLVEGRIKVGVTEMVVHTWLNSFLDKFKKEFPNVILELVVDLAANLESELNTSGLDLCFQSGPFKTTVGGEIPIGGFPMIWIGSAKSIYAKTGKISLIDLLQQPLLTHARNTTAFQDVSNYLYTENLSNIELIPSSNLSVAVEMVRDDYGLGLILEPLAEQYLKDGSLVKLDHSWNPKNLEFYARYHKARSSKVIEAAAKMAQRLSLESARKFTK